ncbi:UPL4_2 [Blepharisma stoltei]|uniref:HECT-type E3 ubiquitin transferase n=1 Tax=Blepharisma stoltei TaxID=1481888 RepID=A0AAU9J5Z8_9CILI|nr:unnamed protein product [Blepharisma stoltei]
MNYFSIQNPKKFTIFNIWKPYFRYKLTKIFMEKYQIVNMAGRSDSSTFNLLESPGNLTNHMHLLSQMQSNDDIEVLNAVMQFSMHLSVASEESIISLPIDHTISTLIYCLNRSLPDICLYAIISLNHILDSVPNASHLLVVQSGVGILCRMLMNLEYIDMAENAIKALERISHDSPSALLREGVFSILANILDFFEEAIQKRILSTDILIAKAINSEEMLNGIIPSLPEMANLLVFKGLGNLWKNHMAVQFYLGLTESIFRFSRVDRARLRKNVESVCDFRAFQNLIELIPNFIEFQPLLFRLLKILCAASPYLIVMLHNIGALYSIKQVLEDEEKQASNENHSLLMEILQLIDVLIPNKNQNDFCSKELEEIYRLSPDLLKNLGDTILPRLLGIYDKIVNKTLRNLILQIMGKLFAVSELEATISYVSPSHFANFLSEVFNCRDMESLRSALKLVMLLYEKIPQHISENFIREGIISKIQNLKNEDSLNKKPDTPNKDVRMSPRIIRSTSLRDSEPTIQIDSQEFRRIRNFRRSYTIYRESEDITHTKVPIVLPKDVGDMVNSVLVRASEFEKTYMYYDLNELKRLARSLNEDEESGRLMQLIEIINKKNISLHEFVGSGIIEALWKWLTNSYQKKPKVSLKRIYEFLVLFNETSSSGQTHLANLISLLIRSIRYTQQFGILLYETITGFSNIFHSMRTLSSRIRLKLLYDPEKMNLNSPYTKDHCFELESKHQLFSSIGSVSLILEQYITLETIIDALLKVRSAENIEFLVSSFEKNEQKGLSPEQFNITKQHIKMQLFLSGASDLNAKLEEMGIRSEGFENLIDEIQMQKREIEGKMDIVGESEMIDVNQPIEAMNIVNRKSSMAEETRIKAIIELNGEVLHKKMSLFEIINKYEVDDILTLKFYFAIEREENDECSRYIMPGPDYLSQIINDSSKLSINSSEKVYSTLRLLKFIYLLNDNIKYLLSPSSLLFNFPINPIASSLLPSSLFTSQKLTALVSKQISDLLAVVGGMTSDWIFWLASKFPSVLSFNQRYDVFRIVGFGGDRSLYFYSNRGKAFSVRMLRQKAMVPRDNVLEAGIRIIGDSELLKYGLLEFDFVDEEGTGLGPTLEFYSLISEEIKKLDLWRSDAANGLFPAPIQSQNLECNAQMFYFIGKLVAKAIYDDKLINLNFSPVFWKLVLRKPIYLSDLIKVDSSLGRHLLQFQELANQASWINEEFSDPDYQYKQLKQVKYKGSSICDLHLTFTLPGYESIDLKPNGKNIFVSLETLEEYINLVCEYTLLQNYQAEAFRKGFEKMIPVVSLEVFEPEELEEVICGKNNEIWEFSILADAIMPAHGYSKDSGTFQDLLHIMESFDAGEKQLFLKFCTGSPRLPLGSFKGLHPPLTIVKKDPTVQGSSPDEYLPSVMTCQNYLKVPEYSSKEILKKQMKYAMTEGNEAFHFS